MAKVLTCSFQHVDSGLHIAACYNRKRLKLEMLDSLEQVRPYLDNDEVYTNTEKWCKEHTNKRFEAVEEAVSYLQNQGIEDYLDFDSK